MKYFGWIFLFFIILYIIPLGSRPMIAPAEFEYAQTAVDMVELNMYTADGGVIAPDTPPMSHWITAASFNLFGINNFAARLPSALAVGITALMIALLVQQNLRDEKLAALASMIFMSFSLVLLAGSTAQPVMLAVMTISGTLGTIFLAVQEKQINRRKIMLLILAGLFAAAGFLTAGFPALVLPLLIVVSYLINSRQLKELALILPIVIISMILPVLPWLIKMSDNCGLFCNFVSFSLFYDSFGSYSWFCYAVLLAAGCCPVWILFPCAILTGKESWIRLFRQPICKFATAALLIPLIYFTICRNENPAMILICFPALSLLIPLGIQAYFNNGGHHRSFDWMLNFWALLLLVCGFTAVGLWFFPAYAAVIMEKLPLSSLSLIVFGVSALLGGGALLYSFRGNWRSRLYLYFFSIALLPLGISWCITSNYQIPEKNIRHLMDNSDVIVDKCEFFTTEELVAAVKWCGGKSVNIVDCACPLLEIADSGKTVCLIVEENHPSLLIFEKFPVFRSNGLAFVKITTGNPAAERNSDVL